VRGASLSAAARELGMSLAVASKRLQRLQDQLGVRVLAEIEEGEELVTRGSK
jgi:DNA-binding transcriptional LysR family regulator